MHLHVHGSVIATSPTTFIFVLLCVRECVDLHRYIYIPLHVCAYPSTHVCVCLCVCCLCVPMCVYIQARTRVHVRELFVHIYACVGASVQICCVCYRDNTLEKRNVCVCVSFYAHLSVRARAHMMGRELRRRL